MSGKAYPIEEPEEPEGPAGCRVTGYEYTFYVDLITRTHLITLGGGSVYNNDRGRTRAAGEKSTLLLKNWTLV